jgi:hypothetical protein
LAWIKGEIDYYVKIKNFKDPPTEELESKNRQRAVFINNAMRAGLIDAATVQRMKSAGYRESMACWTKDRECERISICDEK